MKGKSLALKILQEFLKPQLRYKGVSVNMFGFPVLRYKTSKRYFSNEFSRLKREGYLHKEGDLFRITKRGREFIRRRQDSLTTFVSKFEKTSPKNLIVMFDIPEYKKSEREWFRFHLKKFGYIMIQRSVWVGPSPLPADFLSYLQEIKLKDCVKTFKLAKNYVNRERSA